MVNYNSYYNQRVGTWVNIDGAFGAQCWDAYADYCRYLGVPYANCTTTGYAQDIWTQRQTNGMLDNFTEVTEMEAGDVAVFQVTGITPYSHVAIFHSDAGGGYGWFFGQNQGGTPAPQGGSTFNLCQLPYSATYDTAFRPNAYVSTQTANAQPQTSVSPNSNWVSEDGLFTSDYAIYARLGGPSTGNQSPYLFPAGSQIRYDAFCHAGGYVWIRQPRSGEGYWYIPTGESDGLKRIDDAWGSFE